jgi:hypothetical protein
MKLDSWAWSFTNLPFGKDAPVTRSGSPSFSLRVFIIYNEQVNQRGIETRDKRHTQCGKKTTPSSAMNSKTPACVLAAAFSGFLNWNIQGEGKFNVVSLARADGGMRTENKNQQNYVR